MTIRSTPPRAGETAGRSGSEDSRAMGLRSASPHGRKRPPIVTGRHRCDRTASQELTSTPGTLSTSSRAITPSSMTAA